ncbi:uncharacterized protein [Palaemon carinicauda]|uniref:uncharacterized protein n=1 Tax=Palaemon carinicauda TaxID=392227 RepID=UPI0035B6777B
MKLAIVLLALAAVGSAEDSFCRCGAFITYSDDQAMVYLAPELPIDSCEDDAQLCRDSCSKELKDMSHGGDMWHVAPSGKTVGQHICETLTGLHYDFVHNHVVYGYYEVCGGPWQYTGVSSKGMLCCDDGFQEHCIN